MRFIGVSPHLSPAMADRVKKLVPDQCDGWECESTESIFVRRIINASVTVHIQCVTCGHSHGALRRGEVYNWQDLSEWDKDRQEEWVKLRKAQRIPPEKFLDQRRANYREWLLNSPDWADVRQRVLERAMFLCEACLLNGAEVVHHLTYDLGWLPPAWELRAVCRECHERLHHRWTSDNSS